MTSPIPTPTSSLDTSTQASATQTSATQTSAAQTSAAQTSAAQTSAAQTNGQQPPTLWQCVSGSLMAGGFSFLLYLLTHSIAQSFAAKPIAAKSYVAANIGAAVRTLVVGSCTLATFLFAITALGLLALGIQTALQGREQGNLGNLDKESDH